MPLLERHYHEIAHYKDIPLDVDRESYRAADEAGLLRIYTIRDGASRMLMGYAAYFVGPNLHYRSSRQARQDVLFIAPEYRGGFMGSRLVRFADDCLRLEGVQAVYQHVKIEHPALGAVLRRQNYEPIEIIWAKRLDKKHSARGGLGGEDANKARAAELTKRERVNVEDEDAEHLDQREVANGR